MRTIRAGETFKCEGCGKEWTLNFSVQLNKESIYTCGTREIINNQFTGKFVNGCGYSSSLHVIGANA